MVTVGDIENVTAVPIGGGVFAITSDRFLGEGPLKLDFGPGLQATTC